MRTVRLKLVKKKKKIEQIKNILWLESSKAEKQNNDLILYLF